MKTFHDGKVTLYAGDCLDVLKAMPENSIDAVVTDPPYGLKFMGREWDRSENIAFTVELWAEVLRVLKPGGHMVCFGGTRTYHRMTCAIEDAGFEVRDQLAWVYGSGFPKSHDVSKGIDRAAGAEREVLGKRSDGRYAYGFSDETKWHDQDGFGNGIKGVVTAPATDAARQWQGYGTALKPAWEPICLARKPLSESTVAANVLRWGTGALNIDGCRVDGMPRTTHSDGNRVTCESASGHLNGKKPHGPTAAPSGRWPANLCHDGSPEVLAGFPETGLGRAGARGGSNPNPMDWGNGRADGAIIKGHDDDGGSAARFFYTAKADANDRLNSKHPTVKPVDLMQWLVRLVCPKGATVLDPFSGTGTTGEAAFREGCRTVLIERETEYLADIERRMELLLSGPDERSRKLTKPDPHETLPLFA